MKKLVCVLLAFCLCLGAAAAFAEGEDKVLTLGWSWAHKNDSLFNGMFDTVNAVLEKTIQEHGYTSVEWIEVIAEDNAQ
ncbi:MAG: hypothetical protein GX592_14530, partial [Clostridiales bacterium]|nr:hypothetical protein [Clostridiales bacterium]